MISKSQLERHPIAYRVFAYVKEHYAPFAKTYDFIIKNFDEAYLSVCEELLSSLCKKCQDEKYFIESMKAFIKYSHEYLVLQAKLNKTGRYLYSSFKEVNENVYQSGNVMNAYYLDGLLLSQLLWPNHVKMGQYFISQSNRTMSSSAILDVSSGAGIYPFYIAKYFKYKKLRSIDISQHSRKYTEDLLRCSRLDTQRVSVELKDIYDLNGQQTFDFISCGELLEHLEDPEGLLDRLSLLLKKDGTLFLTTAIYAAAIDHIYLFHNVEEVRKLLEKHFAIESELPLPVTLEPFRPDMNDVPMNYACVLKKKSGPHD